MATITLTNTPIHPRSLEVGEVARDAAGNPLPMTWDEFITWGKTLKDGWRLPSVNDTVEAIKAVSFVRTGLHPLYCYWSTNDDEDDAEVIILDYRYPNRPVYYRKGAKLLVFPVRNLLEPNQAN